MNEEPRMGFGHLLLELLWIVLVVLAPALGVWTASSLAAYLNGPVWLACTAGLLLFPVLPVAWELWAARRRTAKNDTGTRWLSVWDRLALRTLFVNALFLTLLIVRFPAATFAALSTRGDWFLDGSRTEGAEKLRADLFATAQGIEWLYRLVKPNPYESEIEPPTQDEPVPENPVAQDTRLPEPPVAEEPKGPVASEEPTTGEWREDGTPVWPLPATLHPLVASITPDDERSIETVGRYFRENESDPWKRVKALHDWVADRVSYDVDAYRARRYDGQTALGAFRTRKTMCAGYSNLLAALGKVTGDDIRVVVGDARTDGTDLTGEGHAWNVVQIGERWALIDATWDAGSLGEKGFEKKYDTGYLFAPPEIQGVTHFPEDPRWQLREPALTRGDFFRQPVLRPRFFSEGFRLVSPDRSQITVAGTAELALENRRGRYLLAYAQAEGGAKKDCLIAYERQDARVRCELPEDGSYRLQLFAGPQQYGSYDLVGELYVQNRAD
ncbi:MAG: transglutaminase domain-containing protein [Vicinamibacteria bacterium]